jgi:hypothetical protein
MSTTLVKSTKDESVVSNCSLALIEDCPANENTKARAKYEAQKKKLSDK